MLNYFKNWTLFELSWLTFFSSIIIIISIIFTNGFIALFASLTGIICVILSVKGKISNYTFGIISVLLYGYIAFSYGLMGETLLNWFYLFPMNLIGWYFWIKHKNNSQQDIVQTKVLSKNQKILYAFIILFVSITYGLILKYLNTFTFLKPLHLIKNPSPFLDASATILSIFAMFLMVKRYAEQWFLWAAITVVSLIMWFITLNVSQNKIDGNGIITIIMWVAYLTNSVYGYINWLRLYKKQA